jgi:hypothetical protein
VNHGATIGEIMQVSPSYSLGAARSFAAGVLFVEGLLLVEKRDGSRIQIVVCATDAKFAGIDFWFN